MSGFDLDLRGAEEELESDVDGDVVLGILDGTTDPDAWVERVESGNLLVLAVEGDLNALASGFARDVKDMGGTLMHFRGFLIVAPQGVDIDTSQL